MPVVGEPAISDFSVVHGILISCTRPHEKRIVVLYGTFDWPGPQGGDSAASICRRVKGDLTQLAGHCPVSLHTWGDFGHRGSFVGELSVVCLGMDVHTLDLRFREAGYSLFLCSIYYPQQEDGQLISFRAGAYPFDREQRRLLRDRRCQDAPNVDAYDSVLTAQRRFAGLVAAHGEATIIAGVGPRSHQKFKYFVFFRANGVLRAAYSRDIGRIM